MAKNEPNTIILPTDPVKYIPDFIGNPDEIYADLWDNLDWERRENTPRREYWTNTLDRAYSYDSRYGPKTYFPRPTTPSVEIVSDALEAMLGFRYEGCFLNGYENGADVLGAHADDDPGIDHNFPIAVVTVGGKRELEYIELATKRRVRIMLMPGSLLLMLPGMQSTYYHRIPPAGFVAAPRISLTYRKLIA